MKNTSHEITPLSKDEAGMLTGGFASISVSPQSAIFSKNGNCSTGFLDSNGNCGKKCSCQTVNPPRPGGQTEPGGGEGEGGGGGQ